jgi:serine/threonine-protein kinase
VRQELGIPLVAVPIPPPPDGDGVSDVERTMPGITTITAATAPPTGPPAGPRGTMALLRPAPMAAPPTGQFPSGPPTGPQPTRHQGPPPPPEQPKNGRRRTILTAVIAVLVLGGLIGTGAWFLSGPSAPTSLTVPALVGQTQDTAGTTLRNLKLTPKYAAQERSNTTPSGSVLRTDPVAGSQVEPGAVVTVVLSSGKPRVPDITPGMTPDQAEQAIKAEQLTPVLTPDSDYSPTVPEGMVLSVNPTAGTLLDIGGQVKVLLSKGTIPLPPVPDVTGKSKDDAFAILTQAGFAPFQAGEEFSNDVDAGSVTRTNPEADATASGGSNKVGVYLSNAVEVPSLFGMSIDDAKKALSAVGLQPDFKGKGGGGGGGGHGGFSVVYKQSPDPGTKVAKGSKVQLDVFGG